MPSTITIYNWSSGITGLSATGIRGYTGEDRNHYDYFNRPLKRLYENDVSIIQGIANSVVTNKLFVNYIEPLVGDSFIFNGNVNINGSFLVSGIAAVLNSSQLSVKDNIITLNDGEPTFTEGGIEIDRG